MQFAVCRNSLFRKSRHKPNLESTSKHGFSPDLGGKNGGVLSMRMQVILDSPFARPGSAPIGGGKKGEFRDWTRVQGVRKLVNANPGLKVNQSINVSCLKMFFTSFVL